MPRREIDRQERTEAGLDVGEEESEGVERARARLRCRSLRCRRRLLRCRRRRKPGRGVAVEPTAVEFQRECGQV